MHYMDWNDIGRASAAWQIAQGAPGSTYDEFRDKHLPLPKWFDLAADPLSPKYMEQQDRIWQMMIGEDVAYTPDQHELTAVSCDWTHAILRPGLYYAPTVLAGDHLIAMGHIVKHSNVEEGDRVLEYGAGYGQIALTFARRGAEVHTVDIDTTFCEAVRAQAEFFKVSLTPHRGRFGDNPAGGKYKLICFYESFHHARSFIALIGTLRELLARDGRIIMAGEPIRPRADKGFARTCPYPWGIRLESEVAAIVRFKRWYELGFQEEFLLKLFFQNGFCYLTAPSNISLYANLYVFFHRPNRLQMSELQLPPTDESTWHGRETSGRWTKNRATVTIDQTSAWSQLNLELVNHHPKSRCVTVTLGSEQIKFKIGSGSNRSIAIMRDKTADVLAIAVDPISPRSYGLDDDRMLGIFVRSIEYQ